MLEVVGVRLGVRTLKGYAILVEANGNRVAIGEE